MKAVVITALPYNNDIQSTNLYPISNEQCNYPCSNPGVLQRYIVLIQSILLIASKKT